MNGGPNIRTDSVLLYLIPPQIDPVEHQIAEQLIVVASGGAQAVTVVTLIFNLALSASLNQLWSMINTQ